MIENTVIPQVGETYLLSHLVTPSQSGMRLDAFLKHKYRRRSRAKLKTVIEEGRIQLKRDPDSHLIPGRLKPSFQVQTGDEVLIYAVRKAEPEVCFDYKVLYEDEHLFVIDKPPNLPVHPAGSYYFNTLLIHLKTDGHRKPLREEEDFFLPHRIDKETSGVLVIAKSIDICNLVTTQFAERKTEKYYLAIVNGNPPDEFTVDWPIRKALRSRIGLKMEALTGDLGVPAGALPADVWSAFTEFKKLKSIQKADGREFSLVACYPKTGRQHQIRVHLAAQGFPIVGDKLYSVTDSQAALIFDFRRITPEAEARLILPRHALHAASLKLTHPVTGERMEFEAALPRDLADFFQ